MLLKALEVISNGTKDKANICLKIIAEQPTKQLKMYYRGQYDAYVETVEMLNKVISDNIKIDALTEMDKKILKILSL